MAHFRCQFPNTRRIGLMRGVSIVIVSAVLFLAGIGCGVRPKAATGAAVSPIKLRKRSKPVEKTQAEQPAPRARAASPRVQKQDRMVAAPRPRFTDPQPAAPITPREQVAEPSLSQGQTPHPPEPQSQVALGPEKTQPEPLPVEPTPTVKQPFLDTPGAADEPVHVNFEEVDIRTVLKTIGEITGINFIPHESVSGSVTVMSPTPIRLGDVYAFLQSILDVHGYATVETENAVKVVPKEEASKRNLQVRIGSDPAFIPRSDTMVTQILPLEYADAGEISRIVQPLLSTGAQMTTIPRTNSIMITDTSANIHHMAQIVTQLDVESSHEKVTTFPLRYASAQVLSEQITRILNEQHMPTAPSGRGRVTAQPTLGKGPRVLPDERTNSLIAIAGEQDIEIVRGLVAQLDIQRPTGIDNVHVKPLKNADANDVAPSLETALAGMRLTGVVDAAKQIQVTADDSTNSLIIVASPQDYAMISQIVDKLDIVREQVLVEMMILEVTEESLTQIGVDWATLDEAVADSIRGFGLTNLGPRVDFVNGDLEGLAVGAWKETGDGTSIGAILQALQRESAVNILSTPHILTSNHRTATFVVGENRPFVMQSRITEGFDSLNSTNIKSYEYKDVGITLEVTPHISQSGLIRLNINSEFTKLIEDVTTAAADTPTTAKRNAQTVVTMGDGATIVIGGMIRDDTSRVERKVPLLGDMPVVGGLFRTQKDVLQKTNLLIFITPRVMTDLQQLQEYTKAKKREMPPLLGEER